MVTPHPHSAPDAGPTQGEQTTFGSLGRYRLLSRLAVGGMAEIYLARVDGIGGFEKLVVVKRLIPQYAEDPILVRMFMDEARLLAKLDHPNITQVHDVGTQEGQYFFAMEYVHGEDLRSVTRACAIANTTLSDVLAATIVSSAARALHYVHEKTSDDGRPLHIVHRDVSPSNVLVGFNGTVKLADFGVAKWDEQQTSTTHGTLKGKLAYMSPEQAKGGAVDRRSDIFSLGVLMFELFTGTRLFQGATEMAILAQVTAGKIPSPSRCRPDLPAQLEAAICKALAFDPAGRFATAQDLANALGVFIASRMHEPHDASALAELMGRLFCRKLATWHEAEAGGLTLGEHLARLPAAQVVPAQQADNDAAMREGNTQPELLPGPTSTRAPKTRWFWAMSLAGVTLCTLAALWALWPSTPAVAPRSDEKPLFIPVAPTPKPVAPATAFPDKAPVTPPVHKRPPSAKGIRTAPPASTPVPAEKSDKVHVWDPDSMLLPK